MFNFDELVECKYKQWYLGIIDKFKYYEKSNLTEAHHIFPISIYGNNKFVVNLPFRYHFVAHLLLWKMFYKTFGDDRRTSFMAQAVVAFKTAKNRNGENFDSIINSKQFAILREQSYNTRSEHTKKMWQDPETRDSLTKHRQEYWGNEENQKKQSETRLKYFENEENLNKQTEINREITSRPEWREQRSNKQKELSADKEYTALRVKAMTSPEAIAKNKASNRARIDAMSVEERSSRYGTNSGKIWITDGIESKTQLKDLEIPEGWKRGRTVPKRTTINTCES